MPFIDKQKQRDSNNRWYERNKKKLKAPRKKLKVDLRKWFQEFKATLKCSRCSENHPACLQFHHRDPTKKDLEVSVAVQRGWSIKRILEEIAKCDVLCANCHIKAHAVLGV